MSEMTREHLEAVQRARIGVQRTLHLFEDGSLANMALLRDDTRLSEVAAMIEAKLEEKP